MNDLTIFPPDSTLAKEVGQIIDNLRLHQNITQQDLANELGVTRTTYRQLVGGKAKLENVLGALRILGQQDVVEDFISQIASQSYGAEQGEPRRLRASSKIKEEDHADQDGLRQMVRRLQSRVDSSADNAAY